MVKEQFKWLDFGSNQDHDPSLVEACACVWNMTVFGYLVAMEHHRMAIWMNAETLLFLNLNLLSDKN